MSHANGKKSGKANGTPARSNGKHPGGRPSKFTKVLASEICRRLSQGQSLREICRDPSMPSDPTTIRMWVISGHHPRFSLQYAQAREAQADHYFDEMFEIADDGSNDWMERQRRDGTTETVLDDEHVQRSRLRVDTRKWALARMSPKKYGDVAEVKHSGQLDGGMRPLVVMIRTGEGVSPSVTIGPNGKDRLPVHS